MSNAASHGRIGSPRAEQDAEAHAQTLRDAADQRLRHQWLIQTSTDNLETGVRRTRLGAGFVGPAIGSALRGLIADWAYQYEVWLLICALRYEPLRLRRDLGAFGHMEFVIVPADELTLPAPTAALCYGPPAKRAA